MPTAATGAAALPEPTRSYRVRLLDSSGVDTVLEATEEAIDAAAEEWVREGDWDLSECGTLWIDVRIGDTALEDEDGDSEDTHDLEIVLQQPEPDCAEDHEHDWRSPHSLLGGLAENPGVHGHGGGVIMREACAHCGGYRVTDTWAQNPANGTQGHHTVTYQDADGESAEWLNSLEYVSAARAAAEHLTEAASLLSEATSEDVADATAAAIAAVASALMGLEAVEDVGALLQGEMDVVGLVDIILQKAS